LVDRLVLPKPDDFHVHLRRGSLMPAYARRHALSFGRALVMPNTLPPIVSGAGIEAYRAEILSAAPGFEALLAFKLLPGMDASAVRACAAAGAIAGKYYPAGATTNSDDGISDPSDIEEALAAMEEAGLVLCIHAEDPAAPALEREAAFLPVIDRILAMRSGLRVVIEHVSTREALDYLRASPKRVAGRVTAHHLRFSLDDLIGEDLDPHLFCKPVLKGIRDRDALREAVFRGERRIFFGSDSAPHPRAAKEGRRAASGVYSSPCALCVLASMFEDAGALPGLSDFIARNGAEFYRLPPPSGALELERREWILADEMDGAVPMMAGGALRWRIAGQNCP
jgi:dihydroorotase